MKTVRITLLVTFLAAIPLTVLAQSDSDDAASSRATVESLKGLHLLTISNIIRTAEMLDDSLYAFRPTDDVRSAGEILAHVADGQYLFCSAAAGEENPSKQSFEETVTSKEEIVAALQAASDYCSGIYDSLTDVEGAELRSLFGRDLAVSAILAFNSTHNYEHYGNLVTYMRINGIIPPSSQQ